jgi:8-oxo-dGTP diphosphatase
VPGGVQPRGPVLAVGGVIVEGMPGAETVILVRRARAPMTGRWSLPGGRVELGEALHDALRRELLEETSLLVEVGQLLEVVELPGAPAHYVVLDYLCACVSGTLAAGDDAAEATRVRVSDLDDYGVTAAVKRVVAHAVEVRRRLPVPR